MNFICCERMAGILTLRKSFGSIPPSVVLSRLAGQVGLLAGIREVCFSIKVSLLRSIHFSQ